MSYRFLLIGLSTARNPHSFPTRRSSDLSSPPSCRCSAAPSPSPRPGWSRHDPAPLPRRSEEHTSELQSRGHLVCRLMLEKKNSNPTRASSEEGERRLAEMTESIT